MYAPYGSLQTKRAQLECLLKAMQLHLVAAEGT